MRILKRRDLHDADDWVIAKSGSGTLLHQHRQLAPEVTKQFRFTSGRPSVLFVNDDQLQQYRSDRDLLLRSTKKSGAGPTSKVPLSRSSLTATSETRSRAEPAFDSMWNGTELLCTVRSRPISFTCTIS
jgi:hypothetical protein